MPRRFFSGYSDNKSNKTILSKVSTHQKEIIQYFTSILLLNFNLTEVFRQVPKSSIEPPQFDGGGGGGGFTGEVAPGAILSWGGYFVWQTPRFKLTPINQNPGSVHMKFYSRD